MRGRRATAALLLTSFGMTAAAACNLLNGVGDLVTSDLAEAGLADEAGPAVPDAGAGDALASPPTCACVSAPPGGWTGPVALLEGDVARACPTGLTAILDAGTDPSSASPCTPCTCGAPIGSCASALVETHAGGSCSGSCVTRTIGATCGPVGYCLPTSSATATGEVDGGACPAAGGLPAAAAWQHAASACAFAAAPGTTCAGGQACAPKSAAAPDARTCILHAGAVACPPGPYGARVVYDARIADTRACSKCACDPPTGNCSAGTVTLYTDTGCTNGPTLVPTTGACTAFGVPSPGGSGNLTVAPQLLDGGCAADGGVLTDGGLSGVDPTTLCCL
jgi:hypothetical protein